MKNLNDLNKKDFFNLLKEIPKTEIHLHLEGLVSTDSIWNLININQLEIDGVTSKDDLKKLFAVNSLDEFISLFINVIQNAFRKNEDIEFLVRDLEDYLVRNNIVYAEVFFAPTKFVQNGLSFPKMLEILHEGAKGIWAKHQIVVKYIVDVSRTYGTNNAKENLDLTLKYLNPSVIGIGLGGAESKGPAKDFESIFKEAEQKGLNIVAHAGEDVGPQSIWDALKTLHAKRIGHGISAIQDKKLMNYLRDNRIPLEICPTSNLFTKKYVKRLKDHPIRPFFDHGIIATLNTDDPTLFSVELIQEYMKLLEDNFFSQEELITLVKNNLYSTFQAKTNQDTIWNNVSTIIKKYLQ